MRTVRIVMLAGLTAALIAGAATAQQGRNRQGRQGQGRQRQLEEGALKIGQYAPTFDLKSLDGKDTFGLKGFRGEKPVILFFGSYT